MHNSLVVYVEEEMSDKIDNRAIMQRFQRMKSCQEQLLCTYKII